MYLSNADSSTAGMTIGGYVFANGAPAWISMNASVLSTNTNGDVAWSSDEYCELEIEKELVTETHYRFRKAHQPDNCHMKVVRCNEKRNLAVKCQGGTGPERPGVATLVKFYTTSPTWAKNSKRSERSI
jgi:hypothetical protein